MIGTVVGVRDRLDVCGRDDELAHRGCEGARGLSEADAGGDSTEDPDWEASMENPCSNGKSKVKATVVRDLPIVVGSQRLHDSPVQAWMESGDGISRCSPLCYTR